MTDKNKELRIVRGNGFTVRLHVEARRLDGSLVENFDLASASVVLNVIHGGNKTQKEFAVDGNYALITFPSTLTLGWYGMEMTGIFADTQWRWCVTDIFQIVETNEKANIPTWTFFTDDTYFVSGVLTLIGGGGGGVQADWAESNPNAASYIKNKPDLDEYVKKVSETEQTIEGDVTIRGEFQSGAYHRYSEDLTIGTFLLQEGICIDRHHTSNSGIDRRQTISMLGPQNNPLQIKVENWQDIDSVLSLISEIVMSQDVTLRLRNADGTYTEHYLSHKQNVIDDLQTIREGAAAGASAVQPEALTSLVNTGSYNSVSKKIELKHDNTILAEIDATAFIKDGMVNSVVIADGYLVITFNTDAGKEPISISLADIFNPANYYTKSQVDTALAGKASTDVATTSANGLMSKEDKALLDDVSESMTETIADSIVIDDYTTADTSVSSENIQSEGTISIETVDKSQGINNTIDGVTYTRGIRFSNNGDVFDVDAGGTLVLYLTAVAPADEMTYLKVFFTSADGTIVNQRLKQQGWYDEIIYAHKESVTIPKAGTVSIQWYFGSSLGCVFGYLFRIDLNGSTLINVSDLKDDVDSNTSDISAIEAKIPAQASSSNQLADKAFVNSSIATATATYRGAYNLVSDLSLTTAATQQQIATALAIKMAALSITPDNNDYCFVQIPTADATPTEIARVDRYKYNGTAWSFEFSLNNSGFTAAQWAAINSGITSGLVAKLSALPTYSELTQLFAGKADVATTLAGYGIADASIVNGVITLGSNSITPVTDISGKEDKMTIEAVASGTSAITAAEYKYYVIQGTVGNLTVTLPTPEDLTKVQSIGFYFTAGASPSVTFSHSSTVYYYDGFAIEANKTYEINALWNGQNWVIAYAVIE